MMNHGHHKLRFRSVPYSNLALYLLSFVFLVSGCTAYNAGSNLQQGRYALLRGDSKMAQQLFQRAAEIDTSYVFHIGPMKQGVWTYVGRAQYANGDYKLAQKSLEQARRLHPEDPFAPLYLGLALSKDGDRQRAAKEVQTGLSGIGDWLDYIAANSIDRAYWDPGSIIRSGIREELARLESREINWSELSAGAERIGTQLESELDEIRREKRREQRDSSKGDGKGD